MEPEGAEQTGADPALGGAVPAMATGCLAEKVLESLPHGVVVVESEGKLVYLNEVCRQFLRTELGLSPQAGQNMVELIPSRYRGTWLKHFREACNGQTGESEETFLLNGAARSFRISYESISGTGPAEGEWVLVCFEEITALVKREWKQKQLEGELRETIATRETLLSVISHDLRSPIFQLNGLLFLLQQSVEQRDEARLKLQAEDLEERIGHLTHTLDNLLSWSNVRRKDFTPQVSSFSLESVVEHAMGLLKPAAAHKGIPFETRGLAGVHLVTDREMVAFMVRNLLNNAIKYSRQGGKIEVEAEKLGAGWMRIAVKDHGIGMEPDRLLSLKEGNHFLSEAGTWGERGTGLGLKLCYGFVQRLSGRIRIESETGAESSTTVILELPKLKLP